MHFIYIFIANLSCSNNTNNSNKTTAEEYDHTQQIKKFTKIPIRTKNPHLTLNNSGNENRSANNLRSPQNNGQPPITNFQTFRHTHDNSTTSKIPRSIKRNSTNEFNIDAIEDFDDLKSTKKSDISSNNQNENTQSISNAKLKEKEIPANNNEHEKTVNLLSKRFTEINSLNYSLPEPYIKSLKKFMAESTNLDEDERQIINERIKAPTKSNDIINESETEFNEENDQLKLSQDNDELKNDESGMYLEARQEDGGIISRPEILNYFGTICQRLFDFFINLFGRRHQSTTEAQVSRNAITEEHN